MDMQCPHCDAPVESSAKRCPACRRRLPSRDGDAASARWTLWPIAALAVFLVLAGLVTAGMIVSRRARPGPPIVTVPQSPPDKPRIVDPSREEPQIKVSPPPENEHSSSGPNTPKTKPNDSVHPLLEQDSETEIQGITAGQDIFGAIRDRDDVKTEMILVAHPELAKKRNYKGATPLHLAAALGDEKLARRLIILGADVSAECNQQMLAGQTALHIAAGQNHTAIMRMLLDKGARANAKDTLGATPLHEAAAHGSLEAAALLLKSGAALEARQNDGQTPLFWTAVGGNAKVTRLLLDNGAEVNARDYSELTPLTFAVAMDRKEIAAVLRNRGGKE